MPALAIGRAESVSKSDWRVQDGRIGVRSRGHSDKLIPDPPRSQQYGNSAASSSCLLLPPSLVRNAGSRAVLNCRTLNQQLSIYRGFHSERSSSSVATLIW